MPAEGDMVETRAVARLPGLDIEIEHRAAKSGGAEEMVITLRSGPGSDNLGQVLALMNPALAWMQFIQAAWAPWLGLLDGMAPRRLPRRD